MRLPSVEGTMFHGSAPLRNLPFRPRSLATLALNLPGFAFLIRMTLTVPSAALATYAYLLFGSTATPWGSSPTLIRLITLFELALITTTWSPPGFTTQIRRPSADIVIGLE